MVRDAFELSEKYHTPIPAPHHPGLPWLCLHRDTGAASSEKSRRALSKTPSGLSSRLSFQRHGEIEVTLPQMGEELSHSPFNRMEEAQRPLPTAGTASPPAVSAMSM